MSGFFILLALIFVSLFFFALFLGKISGFSKAGKWGKETLDSSDYESFKVEKDFRTGGYGAAAGLFAYLAIMFSAFFFGTLMDWRSEIINNYEKGEYVKVIGSTQYQLNDSTKVEKTFEPRYITKKNYEKKMKDD